MFLLRLRPKTSDSATPTAQPYFMHNPIHNPTAQPYFMHNPIHNPTAQPYFIVQPLVEKKLACKKKDF